MHSNRAMRDVAVGDEIDQYQVTELISRGGMALIFKAIDRERGETVALKIPHPQYESDVVYYQRFRREEEIGRRLDHPGIVKMLERRGDGRVYLAMEHLEGRTLRALLNEKRTVPPERALAIARELAEALGYLHAHGVVHRDLKPENVFVTAGGGIKIIDFGLALDRSQRRLTWPGLSLRNGTPDYMAPEQMRGRRGDARTDVYALGKIVHEMLTGRLLDLAGGTAGAVDPLLGIIQRATRGDPRERHASAAELLADLQDPVAAATRPSASPKPRTVALPLTLALVLAALAAVVWLSH